jgi:hypothetical protein
MLQYLIDLGSGYPNLNKAIDGLVEATNNNTSYYEFFDFMELTCENGVATVCYDGGGDERTFPQQDFLAILIELREFALQPPLDGQLV